jgi:hypothetical protein
MFLKSQNYRLVFGKSKESKTRNLKRKKNRWKTKKIILDNFIKAKAQTKINKINLKSSLLELQKKWGEIK